MFYENEETFINTEGFIKRTTKLISRKKTKNNWRIIRKVFKNIQNKLIFLNDKDNHNLNFNSTKILNFKNYINFHYQAAQIITNLSFYLSIKNQSFNLLNNNLNFKQSRKKVQSTKLKYWLDDFFNEGTDEYSQYSLILSNSSKVVRSKNTNFF
jgi:predicted molibdopterin-dependent oxidoreductase YjgC